MIKALTFILMLHLPFRYHKITIYENKIGNFCILKGKRRMDLKKTDNNSCF